VVGFVRLQWSGKNIKPRGAINQKIREDKNAHRVETDRDKKKVNMESMVYLRRGRKVETKKMPGQTSQNLGRPWKGGSELKWYQRIDCLGCGLGSQKNRG